MSMRAAAQNTQRRVRVIACAAWLSTPADPEQLDEARARFDAVARPEHGGERRKESNLATPAERRTPSLGL